jgi:uncharacterized phage-associated protein
MNGATLIPLEFIRRFSIISEQRTVISALTIDSWHHGPIVKWYYAAFALLRRESDSPWVHTEVSALENVT